MTEPGVISTVSGMSGDDAFLDEDEKYASRIVAKEEDFTSTNL